MRLFWAGLLTVLGALYGWVGLASAGTHRVLGLAGGSAVVVAAFLLVRPRAGIWRRISAAALVGIGVFPLAISTWWSLVTPVLALVALLVLLAGVRSAASETGRPSHESGTPAG